MRFWLFNIVVGLFFLTGGAKADEFAGWGYIANRLIQDGVSNELVGTVYNGHTIPPFDFVPFKVAPRETSSMYRDFLTSSSIAEAQGCYMKLRSNLAKARSIFGVDPALVAAVLHVETHCGKVLGKHLVVNRLSRVASCIEPENVKKNFMELRQTGEEVTLAEVRNRAEYLFKVFYPQLKALFEEHEKGTLDLFELRGSIAGAFGMSQFLPLTFARFAVDGDGNGHISLFSPDDAIVSVAHFFAAHGWKKELSNREKRRVVWNYNKSDPYIDTVLALTDYLNKIPS